MEELISHKEDHDAEKEGVNHHEKGDETRTMVVVAVEDVDVRRRLGREPGTGNKERCLMRNQRERLDEESEGFRVSDTNLRSLDKTMIHPIKRQSLACPRRIGSMAHVRVASETSDTKRHKTHSYPKTQAEMMSIETLKVRLATKIRLTRRAYRMSSNDDLD